MKVEGVFEVRSTEIATNCGKNAVRLRGWLGSGADPGPDKDGPEPVLDFQVIVHTKDGQSPVPLGAKLKVTITDEGL